MLSQEIDVHKSVQICVAIAGSCKTDKRFSHTCLVPPLISDVSLINQLKSDCNGLLNVDVKAARQIYIKLVGISEEGLFCQKNCLNKNNTMGRDQKLIGVSLLRYIQNECRRSFAVSCLF